MIRSILICPDSELRRECRDELARTPLVEVVRELEFYPEQLDMVRILRAHAPKIVFLSVERLGEALAVAAEIERSAPGAQIVGLGKNAEPDVLLQCMRAGIREFAAAPLQLAALEESLLRLSQSLEARPANAPQDTGKVFAFLPAKGGVGSTTIAVNLAAAIAKDAPGSVLLADLDTTGGLIRFLLKASGSGDVKEALDRATQLDEQLWAQLISRVCALDVLPSGGVRPGLNYDAFQVHSFMEFARRNYRTICVDLSGRLEALELELLAEANKIFLITTPEAPSLHMGREKLKYLEHVELASRTHILLNRTPRRLMLSAAELERILGKPVFASLANDYGAVQRALQAATFVSPDTEFGKSLRILANQLDERNNKAPAEHRKRLIEYFSVRSPRLPSAGTLEKPAV
jgi:pilus assembly protein CpaE